MARRARGYDAVIAAPFGRLGVRTHAARGAELDFVSTRVPLRPPRDAFARRVCAIAVIVPCHRVVAAGGLGGFMGRRGGAALKIKRWLRAHERRQ